MSHIFLLCALLLAVPAEAQVALRPDRARLDWQDNSTNETKFEIERCQGASCSGFQKISDVGANVITYTDQGLSPGLLYRYRVRASNASGVSDYSNIAEGITTGVYVNGANITSLPPSRRTGDTSSIVAVLVNKDGFNNLEIITRSGLTLLPSFRADNNASTLPLLVNKSEIVGINGVIQ